MRRRQRPRGRASGFARDGHDRDGVLAAAGPLLGASGAGVGTSTDPMVRRRRPPTQTAAGDGATIAMSIVTGRSHEEQGRQEGRPRTPRPSSDPSVTGCDPSSAAVIHRDNPSQRIKRPRAPSPR